MQHWMEVDARQQSGVAGTLLPDAPDFTACIASGRASNAAQKNVVALTTTQLKAQCLSAYNSIRNQILQMLVPQMWVAQAAAARHVEVTSTQVSAAFTQQLKVSFPTSSAFEAYLTKTGLSVNDILGQVRAALLLKQLQANVIATAAPVSARSARSYYEAHRSLYEHAETRDVRLILVKSADAATAPRAALAAGKSWAVVARQYSQDTTLNKSGAVLNAVTASDLDPEFSASVFKAPVGVIEGPAKSVYGYFLFEVIAVHAATAQTLTQARAVVDAAVKLDAFTSVWKKTSKAKTVCARAYALNSLCGSVSNS
jgi:parvulin-like peptidyl-prolyl isomerase